MLLFKELSQSLFRIIVQIEESSDVKSCGKLGMELISPANSGRKSKQKMLTVRRLQKFLLDLIDITQNTQKHL